MTSKTRGKLITLEGVEGAGKSSQVAYIQELVEQSGYSVLTTREPGGTPLAEDIRRVLLNGESMPVMTELLLMFAARSSHYQDKIEPALASGVWVICDRFIDASYAYQGAGRGIENHHIEALEAMTLLGAKPDLVCLFDLDVELGFKRTERRGEQNRFDLEDVAFMQRVRDAYLDRMTADPERYALIDAALNMPEVSLQLNPVIEKLLRVAHV
jgi:dTMP kinase